jgi:MFS family permease
MVLGSMFLALASFSFIFVTTLTQILIAQLLFAVGFGLLNPSMKVLYGKLEYKGKEASEWALMDGGNMLIMSVASIVGGLIVKFFGLSPLFIIMTVVQLIGTVVLLHAVKK